MVMAPKSAATNLARTRNPRSRACAFHANGLQAALPIAAARAPTQIPHKLGNYHCNNRVYSIGAGRWLSPDQARYPFFNLFSYVGSGVTQRTDPSGLKLKVEGSDDYVKIILSALYDICPVATQSVIDKAKGEQGDWVTGYLTYPDLFCDWEATLVIGDRDSITGSKCIKADMPGSWRSVPGHSKGCELIACLMCSDKTITIKEPTGSNRAEYNDPKGARRKVKNASKGEWGDKGSGSGGGTTWVHREKQNDWNGVDKERIVPSIARILAHELGHQCNSLSGDNQDGVGQPDGKTCGINAQKNWRLRHPEDTYEGTGQDEWEEHRVIKDWENPIAREMGGKAGVGGDRIDHHPYK